NAYRECLGNGTWASKINYSQCEPILDDKRKYALHYKIALIINYLGHCISVGALIVAFMLFLCLRLFLCQITLSAKKFFLISSLNFAWCNLRPLPLVLSLVTWEQSPTSTWLHPPVREFQRVGRSPLSLLFCRLKTPSPQLLLIKLVLLILPQLCIPCPIIIAWAIGKLYYENEQCWFGKEPGKYIDYIYQGPVILVLLINFVFLFNIVRILMTKLRASTTSETIQYRKAVKATLVLLPLLGITYMLFFVNPGEDDISQIVFIYFNSFLQSFQGFFVSVFYCFLNGEVRSAARKRWHRWQDHHSLRVRVARAMSIPTSPTRISFHSIKQTAAV
ncbi:CRFR2 factor, partial [Acrocephalus arundinaceus]|nr:CRFR2 factor [Acrocephalus arundinaceus]